MKILTFKLEHYSSIVLGLEVYFGWMGVGGHFLWVVGLGGGIFWVGGVYGHILWEGGGGWGIFWVDLGG